MLITFEERPSDCAVVERVWRSHSERPGQFHSMATCNWVMVVTRHEGRVFLTVRGPETKASIAECPAEGEWIGIHSSSARSYQGRNLSSHASSGLYKSDSCPSRLSRARGRGRQVRGAERPLDLSVRLVLPVPM